jgi:chromosome segregation ATPase
MPNRIESPLQQAIVDFLTDLKVTQRSFGEIMGVSETTYGPYRRMTSAMGVDMLDKILSKYDGAREALIDYLSRDTDKKPTPAINTSQIMDKDFHYRKIVNLVEDQNDKLEKDIEELRQANDKLKKENEQLSKKVAELEKENHSLQERLNG